MKKLLLSLLMIGGFSTFSHAIGPFIGYVQVSTGGPIQTGGFNISTGTVSTMTVTNTITAGKFSGNGSLLTGISTTSLSATGVASNTTFLRGDNTWGTAGGAMNIGNSVSGGFPNSVLFEDASQNLGANQLLLYQPSSSTQTFRLGSSTATVAVFDILASSQTGGINGIDLAGGFGNRVIDFWGEPTEVNLEGQIIGMSTTNLNGTPVNVGDFVLDAGQTLPNQPNNIRLFAGNADIVDVSSGSVFISTVVVHSSSTSRPSIAFAGDVNTGIGYGGANTIKFWGPAPGTIIDQFSPTNTNINFAGTAAAPALTMLNTNTGFFYKTPPATVGIAANGVEEVDVSTNGVTFTSSTHVAAYSTTQFSYTNNTSNVITISTHNVDTLSEFNNSTFTAISAGFYQACITGTFSPNSGNLSQGEVFILKNNVTTIADQGSVVTTGAGETSLFVTACGMTQLAAGDILAGWTAGVTVNSVNYLVNRLAFTVVRIP